MSTLLEDGGGGDAGDAGDAGDGRFSGQEGGIFVLNDSECVIKHAASSSPLSRWL